MGKVVSIEAGRGKRRKPPRKVTPELLWELLRIHAQCPLDQMGKCSLTVFCKPLAWELNAAMNLPDEEDEGFRRVDELCAAKGDVGSHRRWNRVAMGLLRQAVQDRFCSYPALDSDPLFSPLRHTAEFQEIRSAAIDCQNKFLAYRSQHPQ